MDIEKRHQGPAEAFEQKLTVSTAKHIVLGCGFIRRMHMLSLYT